MLPLDSSTTSEGWQFAYNVDYFGADIDEGWLDLTWSSSLSDRTNVVPSY